MPNDEPTRERTDWRTETVEGVDVFQPLGVHYRIDNGPYKAQLSVAHTIVRYADLDWRVELEVSIGPDHLHAEFPNGAEMRYCKRHHRICVVGATAREW